MDPLFTFVDSKLNCACVSVLAIPPPPGRIYVCLTFTLFIAAGMRKSCSIADLGKYTLTQIIKKFLAKVERAKRLPKSLSCLQ